MTQELKIKITNPKAIEKKLITLGAAFINKQTFTDIYFYQSPGKVSKLAQVNKSYYQSILKAIDGKFEFVKKQPIEELEVEKIKTELTNKYGIKRILKGHRKNFQLEGFMITLNFIDDIGDFLILIGENPTEEYITKKLDIQNPDYIRVPFDELPSMKQNK